MSESSDYHSCLCCERVFKTKANLISHFRFCKLKGDSESETQMKPRTKPKDLQIPPPIPNGETFNDPLGLSLASRSRETQATQNRKTVESLPEPKKLISRGTSEVARPTRSSETQGKRGAQKREVSPIKDNGIKAMLMPLSDTPDDIESRFIAGIPILPVGQMQGTASPTPPDSPRTLPFTPKPTTKSTIRSDHSVSFGKMINTTHRQPPKVKDVTEQMPSARTSSKREEKQSTSSKREEKQSTSSKREEKQSTSSKREEEKGKSTSSKREGKTSKEYQQEIASLTAEVVSLRAEVERLNQTISNMNKSKKQEPASPIPLLAEPYMDTTFEVQLKKKGVETFESTTKFEEIRELFQKAWTQRGVFGLLGNSATEFGSWIADVWRNKFRRGDDYECVYVEEDHYNKKLTPEMFKSLILSAIQDLDSIDGNLKMILQQIETYVNHIPDQTNGKKNAYNLYNKLFKRKDVEGWNEVFEGLVM